MAQQVKKKFIDTTLVEQVDATEQGLAQEISERQAVDQSLQEQVDTKASQADLDAELTAREQSEQAIQDQIDTKASQSDLDAESQARADADQAIQEAVDQVASDLASAVSEVGENIEAIEDRLDGAESGIEGLQSEMATKASQTDLDAESQARISGDESLQAQIDFIISNTDPSAIDSLTEVVAAFQAADEDLNSAISQLAASKGDRLDVVEADIEAIEDRLDVLESKEYIIEADSLGEFPAVGEAARIYVAKDSNKIYRYSEGVGGELDLPEMPKPPELAVTTSITEADDLQVAINNAQDGDVIFLANGTYTYAGLSIAKQIALVGESQEGVLIQDSRSNSQSFMSISVDNVTLKDLTVRHATTDSNIGHAIVASGGGWPQARLNNFRMYNVKSQYSKGGLSIRSNNFVVEGCTFEIVAGSSTRRGILHYGNGGDSFIKDCHFINATTGALRAICPTATSGSNPNDNQSGSLTIEGSTFSGNLSQFVNMDNHQGSAGDFELIVKDNVTPETNAFVVSFGGANNFGDLFSRIVLIGNTLTNNHAAGLGKGVLAIDGISGPRPFRSSALPVVAVDNVLGQLDFRAGYAEAAGSTGSLVGYATAQINEPTVEISEGGAGGAGEYVELSPTVDQDLGELEDRLEALETKVDQPAFAKVKIVVGEELGFVDLDHVAVDDSLVVSVGRIMVHLGDDFTASVVDGKTRLTWINSLANPDGEEKIETGDVVYVTYAYLA